MSPCQSALAGRNWAVKQIAEEDTVLDSRVNPNIGSESDEEKEELERGHILFSQMIALTAIMAEVMDTFYTQVAIQEFSKAGSKSTEMILERAKPVQIKLKSWFSKLPPSVRMDSVEPGKLVPTGKSMTTSI